MDPDKVIRFRDCTILRNGSLIKEDLWIRNGKILDPEPLFFDEQRSADINVYCPFIISPGFIETQINGAFGVDFTSCTADNIKAGLDLVRKGILRHGVTSFCPTVITSSPDNYHQILPHIKRDPGGPHGAEILGLHLEGPFINVSKKGAHRSEFIQSEMLDGMGYVEAVYGNLSNVSIITMAPELNGALKTIEQLAQKGIVVSLGHSGANIELAEEAVHRGASSMTHLFNAMPPFHHRDPGMIGLIAQSATGAVPQVFYGMIPDGIHTHAASLKIAYRTHPRGVVLVTDGISAMGLSEGFHLLGGSKLHISGNRAVIAGTETLCGSIATMDRCIRYFLKATDCTVEQALESATLHPAQMLHIEHRKGTLSFGSDADFVVLDNQLSVLATFIAGECVWQGDTFPSPVLPFPIIA
ncbi:N-acetylglucosamine-6-phosphate deacetylase-like [Paramacrobiotus metropolitanus]|uniref:N-acetylglucosamine-6-phosphate deacetylase-like n=1 Tax=Paramacrobiotus metropolitanus TaxID=2943436 RepID=UPI0024462231|nr:N-acetylglucosamine-6-phosphate deacetylase-like [Paramacrobiotus metropolitanus]